MSEQGGTAKAIIHPVSWPTLNPEPTIPPRGVTTTKALEAGGGRYRGPVHLPQGRGTTREKKLPRGRPVIPKRRGKGQTRKEGAQAHQT